LLKIIKILRKFVKNKKCVIFALFVFWLRELNLVKLYHHFTKFNSQIKEKKSEKEIKFSGRGEAPPVCQNKAQKFS
jgi:hypothetical protein